MSNDIYDACRSGDLDYVTNKIQSSINLNEKSEFGFTPLHCAAIGSNSTETLINLEIIKLLVDAGSDIESEGRGGRTALYLLAEFSHSIEQINYLIEKGANPDVSDEHGNHITVNAMTPESQNLLSSLTKVKLLENYEFEKEPVKLKINEWKKFKIQLSKVFKDLNSKGLLALENVGYTQSDAFEDCSELFHERSKKELIKGFCFYTEQDKERAKEFGFLSIGIWGAPEGRESETISIGQILIEELKKNGFEVSWNGQSSERPEIYLRNFRMMKKGILGIFK